MGSSKSKEEIANDTKKEIELAGGQVDSLDSLRDKIEVMFKKLDEDCNKKLTTIGDHDIILEKNNCSFLRNTSDPLNNILDILTKSIDKYKSNPRSDIKINDKINIDDYDSLVLDQSERAIASLVSVLTSIASLVGNSTTIGYESITEFYHLKGRWYLMTVGFSYNLSTSSWGSTSNITYIGYSTKLIGCDIARSDMLKLINMISDISTISQYAANKEAHVKILSKLQQDLLEADVEEATKIQGKINLCKSTILQITKDMKEMTQ